MIRKIIKTSNRNISFNLPFEYLNKKIEILILPIFEESTEEITFWDDDELKGFSNQLFIEDDMEDYSLW